MRIVIKGLGLAAFVKVKGALLIECTGRQFVFESNKTAKEWEIDYMNSCCNKHDSEVMNLRKLLPTRS